MGSLELATMRNIHCVHVQILCHLKNFKDNFFFIFDTLQTTEKLNPADLFVCAFGRSPNCQIIRPLATAAAGE